MTTIATIRPYTHLARPVTGPDGGPLNTVDRGVPASNVRRSDEGLNARKQPVAAAATRESARFAVVCPSAMRFAWLPACVLTLASSGCGKQGATLPDAAEVPDAAVGDAAGGSDASMYMPVPHPAAFEFTNKGGPVLAHPSIVTVTWPDDAMTDLVRTFDTWITTGSYLDALAQYGIGAATHAGSFVFGRAAPAELDVVDIGTMLANEVAGGLVPPTADRLYVVYTPPGTTVLQMGSRSCDAFGGLHTSLDTAGAPSFIYAVVPRCHDDFDTDVGNLTRAASHEIVEAITDPLTLSNPAWFTREPSISTGAEIVDACPGGVAVIDSYRLSRYYSNTAAHTGQRPCVPTPPGPNCGLWAADPALTIPRGGMATTTLSMFFSEQPDPASSLLIPLQPAIVKLVAPTRTLPVGHGDLVAPVTVSVPADAPSFFDDIVPFALNCDRNYTFFYYIHVKLP